MIIVNFVIHQNKLKTNMKLICYLKNNKNIILATNLIFYLFIFNVLTSNGQNFLPILKKNLKYSIYNLNNSNIENPTEEYDYAEPTFSEKYILLGKYENNQKNSCKLLKGLFDTELGKLIFPIKFMNIRVIDNKYFEIVNCTNEYDLYNMSIIDINLKTIYSGVYFIPNYGFRSRAKNGPYKILKLKNKIILLDKNLNLLFENTKIRQLEHLGNGLFRFSFDTDNDIWRYKWGLINSKGKILIPPVYYGISEIDETKLISVENNNQEIGYFNLLGKNIKPFKLRSALDYSKNGFAIRNDLKEQKDKLYPGSILVDRSGKVILKEPNSTLNYEEIFNDYIIVSKIIENEKYYNFKDIKGNLKLLDFFKNLDFINDSTLIGMSKDSTFNYIRLSKKNSKIIKFPTTTKKVNLLNFENHKLIYLEDKNDTNLIFLNSKLEKIDSIKLDKNSIPSSINKKYIFSYKNNGYKLSKSNGETIIEGSNIVEPFDNDAYYDINNDSKISYLSKLKNNYIVIDKKLVEESKNVWYNIKNYIELTEEYFNNNINLHEK